MMDKNNPPAALPELPSADMTYERGPVGREPERVPAYTADQMRDYALTAVAAAQTAPPREAAGAVALPEHETPAMHDAVMAVLYAGVTRTNTDALWQAYRTALLAATPSAPSEAVPEWAGKLDESDICDIIGVKDGVQKHLGKAPLHPRSKVRDILRSYGFDTFTPDDCETEADCARACCEDLIDWMLKAGWKMPDVWLNAAPSEAAGSNT